MNILKHMIIASTMKLLIKKSRLHGSLMLNKTLSSIKTQTSWKISKINMSKMMTKTRKVNNNTKSKNKIQPLKKEITDRKEVCPNPKRNFL